MRAAKLTLICALLSAVAVIGLAGPHDRTQPSLVVVFVVDQLPAGTLERLHDQLTGGYRRFLDEGLSWSGCRHAHALTLTGPGHATLLSGLDPGRTGIILNDWHDRDAHRETYCVGDYGATAKPGFDGAQAVTAGGLQGEFLADLIKRTNPASKVYAVSGKDRAAILTGGHRSDGSFWYSSRTGGFTSNPSIIAGLPAWGGAFWDGDVLASPLYRDGIPAEWTYPIRAGASPDDYPFEGSVYSRVAPHPVTRTEGAEIKPEDRVKTIAKRILYTPWLDWLTLQLAGKIIDEAKLGADAAPDLLVVSLTAADVVGHTYGPDSQEYLDLILRVDGWVGDLMRHADGAAAKAGRGGALFALSADHGVLPLPERVEGGRRIDGPDLERRIEAAIAGRLKADGGEQGRVIEAIRDGHVYFDRRTLEKLGVTLERAMDESRRALSGFWEIRRIYRRDELDIAAVGTAGDPFLEAYRRSWNAQRGGDLVLQFCEKCLVFSAATGTDHGSPYEYDRRVPMMLLGPGIRRGRNDGACATVDLAPTLADLLGMTFESPRDGRSLLPAGKVDSVAGHK